MSPKHPLHRHLVVLAFAGVLPLVLLTALGLYEAYDQQRELAKRRAMEVTRAIAVGVDSELQRSIAALQVFAAAGSLRRGDIADFSAAVKRGVKTQPNWRYVILSDLVGRVLLNTGVPEGAPLPPMIEMASHRIAAERGIPVVGLLAKGPERYAFAVRAPVVHEGKVLYVVSAVVDPDTMRDVLVRQNLPASWVVSLFDYNGVRVARSRGHEKFIGLPASPSLQELIMATGREGSGISRVLEGGEAFTAYTTLPNGWVVSTGIDLSEVNRPALRTVQVYGAALLMSLLVGLLASLAVARRINEPMALLRDEAQAMGEGGTPRPPQTSIREISDVGDALVIAAERRDAHDRSKDQFLAMLGHELRNPLAALLNAATLLKHANGQPHIIERASEVVQRQVSHLARLTDDLLDVARATIGKVEMRLERVNLAAVASEVLATMASTGRTTDHVITAHLDDAWVSGDAFRLEQILGNLIVNAVKFTPKGGTIVVRTGPEGSQSAISVSDSGMGMSAEFAARAFDLFVQGDQAVENSPGGLGIGLTLVRRLAELHGGTADVRSAGEGRGSEFIVRLPALP